MGDLFTNPTDKEIFYIEKKYFKIINETKKLSPIQKFQVLGLYHRVNILFMIMNAGSGHIGTSFSIIDFLIMFHKYHKTDDYLFSSKGHDSPAFYSIGIVKNNLSFSKIFEFRKLNGLPGHPDRSIKIFKFNTGSLGMGVSKSKGYLRLKKNKNIFVILGDGELQEGQIWESINTKIPKGLKIIIDRNQLQSDYFTKSTSDIGNIKRKFEAFNLKVKVIDGHNFEKIKNALKNLDEYDCLILNTIKGKGVSFMQGNKNIYRKVNYPYHSGAPNYEIYKKALGEVSLKINNYIQDKVSFKFKSFIPKDIKKDNIFKYSLISIYEDFLLNKFKTNKKLFCLDADLLIDHGLLKIKKRYSNRFIECGIAEMDMVSQASGIAENGGIPICHSFSCFMSFRSLEQIYNNCSEKRDIIYTASLVGVVPSGPGHSHQAVKDFSNYGTIPNLIVSEPIDLMSLDLCYKVFFKNKNHSLFIRMNPLPVIKLKNLNKRKISDFDPFLIKDWNRNNKKQKVLIITYGAILSEQLLRASDDVKEKNLKIISLIFLNKFNHKYIKSNMVKADKIIFYDNQISGLTPFTLLVTELNTLYDFYFKYKSYSINEFPKCGKNDEILDLYNFSSKRISINLNKI